MRHIGFVSTQLAAERFNDYLLSQGIPAQVEEENGQWAIWVTDEDKVGESREALVAFEADPQAERYETAVAEASRIRAEARQRQQETRRTVVDVRRDVWNQPATQRIPVTVGIIVVCVIIAFVTQFGEAGRGRGRNREPGVGAQVLSALSFRAAGVGGDGWTSIRQGQLWRLATPALLHMSMMHLGFNMLGLFYFGGQIEDKRGWPLAVFLIMATAAAGNIAQGLLVGPGFGGMSGALYGLFGYILVRQNVAPHEHLQVSNQTTFILFVWLLLCFTPLIGNIANHAHVAGLLAGVVIAYVIPGKPS